MDKLDREILSILTEDSRVSAKNVAAALQIKESEAQSRIRKMEEDGVIVKYTAIVSDECCSDDSVEALIEVKVTPQRGHGYDAIADEVALHSEVQSLYLMSGAYDLAVIVRGKSLREIARFVSEKISTYETVISTATHFILKKYKVEGAVMKKNEGEDRLKVQA